MIHWPYIYLYNKTRSLDITQHKSFIRWWWILLNLIELINLIKQYWILVIACSCRKIWSHICCGGPFVCSVLVLALMSLVASFPHYHLFYLLLVHLSITFHALFLEVVLYVVCMLFGPCPGLQPMFVFTPGCSSFTSFFCEILPFVWSIV